jgi:hypothetical protein
MSLTSYRAAPPRVTFALFGSALVFGRGLMAIAGEGYVLLFV